MKTLFFALVVSFFFANMSHAFPLFANHAIEPVEDASCANYTGQFKGVCIFEGKRIEDTINIQQQGCEILAVNGMDFVVGSAVSMACAAPAVGARASETASKSAVINWNADKSFLKISGSVLKHNLTDTSKSLLSLLDGEIKLEGAKLLFVLRGSDTKEIMRCDYGRL